MWEVDGLEEEKKSSYRGRAPKRIRIAREEEVTRNHKELTI